MATHVITTNHISLYGHPSPANSSTTTANTANTVNTANIANTSPNHTTNNSPTSPHLTTANLHQLPLQSRQLRPPKAPLYVPAALRPTERPQKHSPPTPPRSVHGSLDGLNDSVEIPVQAQAPISRRSTMESTFSASNGVSKLAEDEWMKNEHLGSVTGLPTKDHWKADRASSNCDSPTCRSSFGLFLRRHHCRHCGHVFCSSHTPHLVPLDQDARFHPDGVPSRACDLCWLAFNRWEETRGERLTKIQSVIDSQNSSGSDASNDSDGSEVSQDEAPKAALTPPTAQSGEIAASVPRGWNWSTF